MYVSFIVSCIVRCRLSFEIICDVWVSGVIGDSCICVCGCGCIGDIVVSKVMLVRFSPVVVGDTAGAVHSSPLVLEVGVGDCRSEGRCAGSVHSSIDCSVMTVVVPVLSGSVFAW